MEKLSLTDKSLNIRQCSSNVVNINVESWIYFKTVKSSSDQQESLSAIPAVDSENELLQGIPLFLFKDKKIVVYLQLLLKLLQWVHVAALTHICPLTRFLSGGASLGPSLWINFLAAASQSECTRWQWREHPCGSVSSPQSTEKVTVSPTHSSISMSSNSMRLQDRCQRRTEPFSCDS